MSSVSILRPEAECGLGQSSSAPRLRPHMLKECPSSAPCNGRRRFSQGLLQSFQKGHQLMRCTLQQAHSPELPCVALSINGSTTALYI